MLEPQPDDVTIRRAESPADYRACQDAQRRAWGITEENYVVPVATMVGAQLHGGLVLGAFRPDGSAAGLSFAFLGEIEGRIGLYSQLTGVVPEYQGRRLGERLKATQRDLARAEGRAVIAWAFDPLQAGNAHFNLARLGATVGRYVDDMYGPRTDALNAGVPTDRVIAVWETDPDAPRFAIEPAAARALPRLIVAEVGSTGALEPGDVLNDPTDPLVLLEIPADIAGLRAESPPRAEAWRQAVRAAFTSAFAARYRAVGFLREGSGAGRRCFYVLQRPVD
jgi:predicted GNAT superfamily acetyltransferase